ncbi:MULTISPECIES: hypothetical protein [unclassified Sporosarcina]|uniref:hypothetical protein n=1 Tax=unclassified Sporosarcina TaxID=2647733 RepID=UPI002041C601|nr:MULTISPECIES: hypothetical protein [unclassified Sporosarcina]GKV64710.1 hypothetical protein NCCP2331_08630 [Sporosarcina sp. NCCP-2331]GLB54820.1 hypothetical protein NCCP2378_06050 [Sporosarcina sp. NCCP-2378]
MSNGQEQIKQEDLKHMYIETPVKTIFNKFANHKDVSLVYGEPIDHGLQKVIPVAKVKYAVGGGGDGRGGDGGGGSFSIKPAGVYIITPDEVIFQSTLDRKKLTGLGVIFGGILGLLTVWKRK